MKIEKIDGLWKAFSIYEERTILKAAGWWWHPGPGKCDRGDRCKACKAGVGAQWWTPDLVAAARLSSYADGAVREELEGVKTAQVASKALEAPPDFNVPAPAGLEYLPFQKAGIAYAMERPGVLIADEMGCVSGDTIITISRARCTWKCKISDVYNGFHGRGKRGTKWRRDIPTYCKSLCDGELRHHRIKNIIDKGEKETVLLTLSSKKTLRLTPDHEVAMLGGKWKAAGKLKPGDQVVTNGIAVCRRCGSRSGVIRYPYARFVGYCRTCMYRHLREKPTYKTGSYVDERGYVYISGQQEHPKSQSGKVREHVLVMERHLGRKLLPGEIVHHKNGNKSDNRLKNLQLTNRAAHQRTHKAHLKWDGCRTSTGGIIKFIPSADTVRSVVPAGKDRVYDIVMDDPHRNFVANGIVVHNCGKTIQALGVINADPKIKKVLVVCPATLRINWAREAQRWLVRPMKIRVIEGRDIPDAEDELIVVNYEKLIGVRGDRLFNWIMAREHDLLVVDESHFLKTPSAQRTKLILGKRGRKGEKSESGIVLKCRRKLFLTGTPILNKPVEIFGLLNTLAPATFPEFFPFAKRYCGAYQGKWGWDFDGATNLPELQEKMRSTCMIRRLKKDVLKELPPKRRQVIVLPTNGAKHAVDAENEAFQEIEEELFEAQAQADLAHAAGDDEVYKEAVKRLRKVMGIALSQMSKVRHDTAVSKVPAVIAHLDGLLEDGLDKVICFAHHHDVINALRDHYGDSCVVITGETAQEDRMGIVDRFQTDPNVKVFLGGITAAGVGITLTAASTVVFAELDWVPGNVTQAEDRAHRIGQVESVLVQHLVLDKSLDARMAQTIVEKQEVMDKALDLSFERDLPALGTARPPKYPPATDEQKAAALHGLRILAGVCDGAVERDNVGYNGLDSRIGKSLAARSKLTDGQFWLARRILPKYHGQIGEEILRTMGYEMKEKGNATLG